MKILKTEKTINHILRSRLMFQKIATLSILSIAISCANAFAGDVLFTGKLDNGAVCSIQTSQQGETLATVEVLIDQDKFTFYNETLGWESQEKPEIEGLFDADFGPIIGAPMFWVGRLNNVKVRVNKSGDVITGFTLNRVLTVGMGIFQVWEFESNCK
jgi:hypothetical protein